MSARLRFTLAACALALAGGAAAQTLNADLRAVGIAGAVNDRGPLAQADALQPGIATVTPDSAALELDARGHWKAFTADALLSHTRRPGGATQGTARFNELYADAEALGWQWSAGKKIVAWDVGYGFRPNDVVQQQTRRTLLDTTPEGRPLLQAEHFGADDAWSLVWVQPERWNDAVESQRGARESALAARGYWRFGALDAHLFARRGRHTGASAGAALAWVATDALELHASVRALQRHDGWQFDDAAGAAPVTVNPWSQATLGGASQWLLGASWTGAAQQSLLVEAWHDGTAPSRAQWRDWNARNAALAGFAATLPQAAAGNLAWQAAPMNGASLQRDNLFVRLAWQPEAWTFSLDALYHPADHGLMLTAAVQWQGDRWRLNGAWRTQRGPGDAVLAQLPVRQQVLLAATRSF